MELRSLMTHPINPQAFFASTGADWVRLTQQKDPSCGSFFEPQPDYAGRENLPQSAFRRNC
jgi:hypothetical protein